MTGKTWSLYEKAAEHCDPDDLPDAVLLAAAWLADQCAEDHPEVALGALSLIDNRLTATAENYWQDRARRAERMLSGWRADPEEDQ